MRKISIFTPAFNSSATLPRSVASLRNQTYKPWEILTARDGGNIEAWTVAEMNGVQVLNDHNGTNRGLAASCNTALRHCTGDYLAKVDSDVELSPQWLEKVMPYFRDERVAGVGGRLIETFSHTLPGRWRSQFMPQNYGVDPLTNPPFLFGADCIFDVAKLKSVGGWNERYKTNFEDVNLCRRLKEAGFVIVYEPKAMARHMRQDTLAGVLANFWRWHKDASEDAGYFGSIEAAAKLIDVNCHKATQQIAQVAVLGNSPELAYPSLLLFFWMCLSDLEYLATLGSAPEAAVKATQNAVCITAMNKQGLPVFLGCSLANDLERWCKDCETDWQPDPAYIMHFNACLAMMSFGPAAQWAMETSLMTMEGAVT